MSGSSLTSVAATLMHRGAKAARSYTFRNHHCGGGAYGATGAIGAPYVTGAVAQGLQTGGGAGHAGAHGAGRWQSQLQQPQPALLTAKTRIATMSDVLFMIVSPYYEEHPLIQIRRVRTGSSLLPVPARTSR